MWIIPVAVRHVANCYGPTRLLVDKSSAHQWQAHRTLLQRQHVTRWSFLPFSVSRQRGLAGCKLTAQTAGCERKLLYYDRGFTRPISMNSFRRGHCGHALQLGPNAPMLVFFSKARIEVRYMSDVSKIGCFDDTAMGFTRKETFGSAAPPRRKYPSCMRDRILFRQDNHLKTTSCRMERKRRNGKSV